MRRQTLLKKLVVSFILVSLIPALLTAGVTFYRNNRDLKASIISENQLSLLDISERTSEKIQQVDMFFYWVSQNTQIQQLLNLTASEAASYSEDKALAIKELRSQTSYRPIAKDMLLFVLQQRCFRHNRHSLSDTEYYMARVSGNRICYEPKIKRTWNE